MPSALRSPYERAWARRRRGRALAWLILFLLIASSFAARILLR
jgi:hypothetical protein